MKKILSVVLVIIMMLTVVACGNKQKAEKYCSSCGVNNPETSAFCGSCGASLNGGNSTAATNTVNNNSTADPTNTSNPIATEKPTVELTATPKPTVEPTATPKPTLKPTATPVAVTELYVYSSDKQQEMCVSGTISLADKITVKPSSATNKTLTWKSSNTSVATVDKNGNVTAKAGGSAKITATSSNGISTYFDINVCDFEFQSLPLRVKCGDYLDGGMFGGDIKIIKFSNIRFVSGILHVTMEGEVVSRRGNCDTMAIDMIATNPEGYVYCNSISLNGLPLPGYKFKTELALFTASRFGSDRFTAGTYKVEFQNYK